MVAFSIVSILAFLFLIICYESFLFVADRCKLVGGLLFFRFGRFGGSFYLTKR